MCNKLGFEINRTYVARKNNRCINQDLRRSIAMAEHHNRERIPERGRLTPLPLGLAIVFMLAAASTMWWFIFLIVYVISP